MAEQERTAPVTQGWKIIAGVSIIVGIAPLIFGTIEGAATGFQSMGRSFGWWESGGNSSLGAMAAATAGFLACVVVPWILHKQARLEQRFQSEKQRGSS